MSPYTTSLADQLRPVQERMQDQYASVVPVSQVSIEVYACDGNDPFATAQQKVLQWIAQRVGQRLPEEAWAGQSFETEKIGAQYAAAALLDDPEIWGARLDDADKSVPQLTWVTEVGLKRLAASKIAVSARLVCTRRGPNIPIDRSVPDFVRQIAAIGTSSLDGRLLRPIPWLVSEPDEVRSLCDLLQDPKRRAAVLVAALPAGSTYAQDAACPIDALCRRTFGAAHVVLITEPASYGLTHELGREFSVFNRAVRNYLPNFNPKEDEPHQHPWATARRIHNWDGGPAAYTAFLADHVLKNAVERSEPAGDPPSFAKIRRLAAEQRIAHAKATNATIAERLELAEAQIVELQAEREEMEEIFEGVLKSVEQERDEAQAKADTSTQRARNLRARVEMLEEALSSGSSPKEPEIPRDLNDFGAWCATHLAGFVEVLPRAKHAAKKSKYEDPSFLYKALLLLRDYYVPMRRLGGSAKVGAFKQACSDLNIEETQTFAGDRYGEHGDTYFVRYGGQSRLLNRHLKKGSTHDVRRCFRLYFFWDEDSEQAVVGWLPSHLDTRKT